MSTANTKADRRSPDSHGDRQLGERHARQGRRRRSYLNIRQTTLNLSSRLPFNTRATIRLGKKGLGEWFSSFQGPIGYEIRDLNITTGERRRPSATA